MYYQLPAPSQLNHVFFKPQHQLALGDFLNLTMSNTFERNNTLGLSREEMRIRDAEEQAGTYFDMTPDPDIGIASTPEIPAHPYAMNKEEWEQSPNYRKGISFTAHMTEQRAQIYADIVDRRAHEKELLAQSGTGAVRTILGFGAGMLASLADPINFVPVMGAAARGASIGAKAVRGALEGAGSNVLADAVIFPVANARGEDFGLFDVTMDAIFGAALGGGIGALGGKVQEWRTNNFLGQTKAEQTSLIQSLTESGLDDISAQKAAKAVFTELSFSSERSEIVNRMRSMIGGEERQEFGLLFDRVVQDLQEGKVSDIAPQLERLQLHEGYMHIKDDIYAKELEADPFSVIAMLRPEDIEPMIVHYGTGVVLDGKVQVKGGEVKAVHGSSSGFGVIKVIVKNGDESGKPYYVTRNDILSLPRIVRDFLPIDDAEHGGRTWVVQREDGKQLVIGEKRIEEGNILATMYIRDADKPLLPYSEKKSPSADSARQEFSALIGDTQKVALDRQPNGQQGANTVDALETPNLRDANIAENASPVNTVNTIRENNAKNTTPEAFELDRLNAEGKITQEDAEILKAHEAEATKTEELRENALSVVSCIAGLA